MENDNSEQENQDALKEIMEKDLLDMTVADLLTQVMSRGTGTIHTMLEWPAGEYEKVHVSVTYGTPESEKMHVAVGKCAQEASNMGISMTGEKNGETGEITVSPWTKRV